MEKVTIGVDPHKLSATIEVVDHHEKLLGSGRFTTDQAGYSAMRTYAKAWPDRVWAVEGGNGAGRPSRNDYSKPVSTSWTCRPSSRPVSGSSIPPTTARPTPATPTPSLSSRSAPPHCGCCDPTVSSKRCGCCATAARSLAAEADVA